MTSRHRFASRWSAYITAAVGLLITGFNVSASPVNKCVVDGTVTYQQGPCPTSRKARKDPTLEELNAEEKKRRAAAALSAPAKLAPAATNAAAGPAGPAVPVATDPAPAFRCDGRRYCSQMSSCAEAKYFLANCPGVKMDGNRDGTPCEAQWCRD